MLKTVGESVWAFDIEWVPDAVAGRNLYGLPQDMPEEKVWEVMWAEAGATDDNPRPFIKIALSKIVSVAAVVRIFSGGSDDIHLLSFPMNPNADPPETEASIIQRFLEGIGNRKPQLVGYNSFNSDIKILIQRGIAHGLSIPGFAKRPDKPWEGYDYAAKTSEGHIDLGQIVGGWGMAMPSLNEMAVISGIPGKLDMEGADVAERYLRGELAEIVSYNEFDALTTYLLWLRTAHFGGFFNDEKYEKEQGLVAKLLRSLVGEKPHLQTYLDACKTRESSLSD